ncbi:MAG TPA: hypothetical protein VEZ12_18660 [Herpetosiphonaceae bacterium]|nr:hypothetical protein [Herpetosiphonaceae bacterium]
MKNTLTRLEVREQVERYLAGSLTRDALAAWAFKQFADQEEELLVYEVDQEALIEEMLDELMWADTTPFVLDSLTAQSLVERLQ